MMLHTEMIVDGTHSHPASVAIAYRMKGNERFYLITDAMRAKVCLKENMIWVDKSNCSITTSTSCKWCACW